MTTEPPQGLPYPDVPIDNRFDVSLFGDRIVVLKSKSRMNADDAINLAAWLVVRSYGLNPKHPLHQVLMNVLHMQGIEVDADGTPIVTVDSEPNEDSLF